MFSSFRRYVDSVGKYFSVGRKDQPLTKSKRRLLLEPLEDRTLLAWDLTISANPTTPLLINHVGGSYTATGSGANIAVADILTDLNATLNVSVSSGPTGAESGAISWSPGAPLNYNMAAPRSLQIAQDPTTTTGVVTISSNITATATTLNVSLNAVNSLALTNVIDAGGGTVSLAAPGGIFLGADITAGTESYAGTVTLGASTNLMGTLVTFGGTVAGGGFNLTITANAVFGGVVTGVNNLSVSGTTAINGGVITTAGSQTYTGAVTLGANAVLTGSALSVTSVAGGGNDLSLNFTSAVTINGAVYTGIRNLTTGSGGSVVLLNALTTTGNQTYTNPASLGANANLTAVTVSFNNTLAGSGFNLTITGNAVFDNTVSGVNNLSVTGTTAINTTAITTTGTQSYGGAATLGASTNLTGTVVTFVSTVAGGGFNLTITGNAVFGGTVTGVNNLSVTGTTAINSTATTTNAQTYNGTVTLSVLATTLTASTVTFNGAVSGSVSLTVNGATVTNGGSVNTGANPQTYNGAVILGANTVLTMSTVAFGGPVSGFNLTVNGNTAFNGGSINTGATNTQTYTGAVMLGATTVLTAATVTFGGPVNGNFNMTVNGATAINGGSVNTGAANTQTYTGAVLLGATTVLTASTVTFGGPVSGNVNLTVNGATAINGGSVTTTGNQTYNNAVTLGANTTLNAGAGNMSFASTVNGASALTVTTTGMTTFSGVVGGGTALTSLTVDSGDSIRINASSRTLGNIAAMTCDFIAGPVNLSAGGNIAVTATGNATFDGTSITAAWGKVRGGGAKSFLSMNYALNSPTIWSITGLNGGSITNSMAIDIPGGLRFGSFGNLTGGSGTDSFLLSGGTLTGSIDGGGGVNTLTGDNVANSWTVTGLDAGAVNGVDGGFRNIQNLVGGSNINSFTWAGGMLTGSIDGGVGNNRLEGCDASNVWTITGLNSGSVNGVGSGFRNIQNLLGGGLTDRFVFGAGGWVEGNVDGGAGFATLDNTSIPGATVIITGPGTLHGFMGRATGIEGMFDNIDAIAPRIRAHRFQPLRHHWPESDERRKEAHRFGCCPDVRSGWTAADPENLANSFSLSSLLSLASRSTADRLMLRGGMLTSSIDSGGVKTPRWGNLRNVWTVISANADTVTGVSACFSNNQNPVDDSDTDAFILEGRAALSKSSRCSSV